MLFDTDVLIWLLRNYLPAVRWVEGVAERQISVVTYLELLQGVRNRDELRLLKRFLAENAFQMLPLSEKIGHRAVLYLEEHALSGGLGLGDALVAATAVEHRLALCTANQRHYRPISELKIEVFRP